MKSNIYQGLITRPRKLFLCDSLGALLTALCLSLILPGLEMWVGLPGTVLYLLASVACIYAVYSFCCYLFIRRDRALFLQIIAGANICYCILTIAVLILHFERLKFGAWLYFPAEVAIICGLANAEWKAALIVRNRD